MRRWQEGVRVGVLKGTDKGHLRVGADRGFLGLIRYLGLYGRCLCCIYQGEVAEASVT